MLSIANKVDPLIFHCIHSYFHHGLMRRVLLMPMWIPTEIMLHGSLSLPRGLSLEMSLWVEVEC